MTKKINTYRLSLAFWGFLLLFSTPPFAMEYSENREELTIEPSRKKRKAEIEAEKEEKPTLDLHSFSHTHLNDRKQHTKVTRKAQIEGMGRCLKSL